MLKQQKMRKTVAIASVIFAVILGAPAIYMVENQLYLGSVVTYVQETAIGGYFKTSSVVLVMFFEFLIVSILLLAIAIIVRLITRKTVVDNLMQWKIISKIK